jgi:SAM-dependent methyltransferase
MRAPSDRSAQLTAWQFEEEFPFTGWDFSHLAGRLHEDPPPWSYLTQAAALLRHAHAVLDLATGGGERLLDLRPAWPAAGTVTATEEYAPNFALAQARLAPLGVRVVNVNSDELTPLPFADAAFDLILNRHGGFSAAEVARVLAPGGVFYTQQVHGLSTADLLAHFSATPQWPYATGAYFGAKLAAEGLQLTGQQEFEGKLRFADVGAVVYYLKAVPWAVPGFSVATHGDALFALQERLDAGEELAFTTRYYTLQATRP